MNYLDLIKLAFAENSLKTVIQLFPFVLFALAGLTSILFIFSKSYREKPTSGVLENIFGNVFMACLGGLFFLVIALFCLPKFNWLELSYQQSTKTFLSTYNNWFDKNIKKSESSFIIFKAQERELKEFKVKLADKIPKGEYIYGKDVEEVFKKRQPLFLNCLEETKDKYIKELEKIQISVEYIEEDIKKFAPECSKKVADDILKTGL